jgi:hypothetical protein
LLLENIQCVVALVCIVGDYTIESLLASGAIVLFIGVVGMFMGAWDIASKTGVAIDYKCCLLRHLITQSFVRYLLGDYTMRKDIFYY